MRILTTLGLFKGEGKVRGSEASLVNSGVIAEFAAGAATVAAAHSSSQLGVTERHQLRRDSIAPPTCLRRLIASETVSVLIQKSKYQMIEKLFEICDDYTDKHNT